MEGPVEWHGDVMPNRLKGLGIDDLWTVKFAGAANALWAELDAARKKAVEPSSLTGLQTLLMRQVLHSSTFLPISKDAD